MDYEIVWSEGFLTDPEEITTYLAQHSPPAAERTATAIHDRVNLLRVTPHAGTSYPPGTIGSAVAVEYASLSGPSGAALRSSAAATPGAPR